MTKHDTWVKLKPGSPIDPILNLFPDGMIPMRDPFPLERVTDSQNNQTALWIVDLERLSSVRAMVDALNVIDPENQYSLVGYDDEFEDDEIYE
ncbi:MAG: hypothetical protein KME52_30240 [Desmonostoc geniculatum HA4340-LM1]|jgi:hypothetical protein|nr:hypothetical protein [Desmonostoc geniculatum HA4340-LM1]